MKEIKEWLMTSNHYKQVILCLFIALGACIIAHNANVVISTIYSIYTVGVVSVSIEYIKHKMGGKFDTQDLLASGIGAGIGILTYYLLLLV